MRRALIIGHTGQDGHLLWEFLKSRDYELAGVSSTKRERAGGIGENPPPLSDRSGWGPWMQSFSPDEVYYLAAYHGASERADNASIADVYRESRFVHADALSYILQSLVDFCPQARLFYASSCLVFGSNAGRIQNEKTPYAPEEIYAVTKIVGTHLCEEYRRRHGLFATVGILYNHESGFRRPSFLTQKVIRHAIDVSEGRSREKLLLGSIEPVVDWSHAEDFVKVFHALLELEAPETLVVSSGKGHSVREYLECAYSHFGLNWREHVEVNRLPMARTSGDRVGDPSRLRELTGNSISCSLQDLVARLVRETQEVYCPES